MAAYSMDDFYIGGDLSNLSDFEELLDNIEDTENNDDDDDDVCICGQLGTMEMILCENTSCSVKWFHYECVSLTKKTIPKGKWYCKNCTEGKEGDTKFKRFSETTIGKLWNCIEFSRTKYLSVEADNEMWRSFHFVKISTIDSWHVLLAEMEIQFTTIPANILYQELLLDLMKLLISESNRVNNTSDDVAASPIILTKDEEEILRYLAGYIPHALLKRYRKLPNNITASAFTTELLMWKEQKEIESTSFYAYTHAWISKQNRGGLFQVNDKVFLLFRELEVVFQEHVTGKTLSQMKGVNLNNLLMGKLQQNRKVDRCWCAVINGRLQERLSLELQQKVYRYWIKIRSKAFVKVYLDLQKKKDASSVSGKCEKALRKTLHKN
ncbi:uncharacterized protein [Antedon mediterranea]|uniref:uncharacterized protein n=1 Tax=Antedon mediterranea TaxID=105859 RepID=UPI003AF61ACB